VATFRHTAGDFLRAALPVGLQVRRCEEPQSPRTDQPPPAVDQLTPGAWHDWPWSLMGLVPAASAAADSPLTIIWHFQLA
jgi:hypothetical protein